MPVIETGIVVGYLVSLAVQKARRAGRRLDETANLAIDASAERLDELIRDKLCGNPVLRDMDEQASALAADSDNISSISLKALKIALDIALNNDPDFSREIAELMHHLQNKNREGAAGTKIMSAKASGSGRVYQAGRDQSIIG